MSALDDLNSDIVACTKCPRLSAYIREVGRKKRRMYMDWDYWARPIPSFGTADARLPPPGLGPSRPRREPHRQGLYRRPQW